MAAWSAAHPSWGLRAYRTPQGLRLMAVHALLDPAGAEADRALRELGSDPLFVRLCRAQGCFRARLSPKPWRLGLPRPVHRFPRRRESDADFQAWLRDYEARSEGRAACRYLRSFGPEAVHPEVAPVLALHDLRSRAESALPLA